MNPLKLSVLFLSILGSTLLSCNDDDAPAAENEEEVIDNVILTFTPATAGSPVIISAIDPDGEGASDFIIQQIYLASNTVYTLNVEFRNNALGEDITTEVAEEGTEHIIYFGFTSNLFSDPAGDGNIGSTNRNDAVNYTDEDENGIEIGLSSVWITGDPASGEFRLLLKHQPGIKSEVSSSTDGETDIDLIWNIVIN